MSKEIKAFQDAGLIDYVAKIAEVEYPVTVVLQATEDGTYHTQMETGEWDDLYDEPIYKTVSVDYKAGEIVYLAQGEAIACSEEDFTQKGYSPSADDEAVFYALSEPALYAPGIDGEIFVYNDETGNLQAKELGEFAGKYAFVGKDGQFVCNIDPSSLSKSFEDLNRKQIELDFSAINFFSALNDGLARKIKAEEYPSNEIETQLFFLNNAIQLTSVQAMLPAPTENMRLKPESWGKAVASLGDDFELPGGAGFGYLNKLEGQLGPMKAMLGASALTTIRLAYANLTDTPLEDVRVFNSPKNEEDMMDPQDTVQAHFGSYVARGKELDVPEGVSDLICDAFTNENIGLAYTVDESRLAEVEGMRVLFIKDFQGSALYFFPKEPELITKEEFEMSSELGSQSHRM